MRVVLLPGHIVLFPEIDAEIPLDTFTVMLVVPVQLPLLTFTE